MIGAGQARASLLLLFVLTGLTEKRAKSRIIGLSRRPAVSRQLWSDLVERIESTQRDDPRQLHCGSGAIITDGETAGRMPDAVSTGTSTSSSKGDVWVSNIIIASAKRGSHSLRPAEPVVDFGERGKGSVTALIWPACFTLHEHGLIPSRTKRHPEKVSFTWASPLHCLCQIRRMFQKSPKVRKSIKLSMAILSCLDDGVPYMIRISCR